MSAAAKSILVYSIYTFGLGATLLLSVKGKSDMETWYLVGRRADR